MPVFQCRRDVVAVAAGVAVLAAGLVGVARSQSATTSSGPGPDLLPVQFQHAVGNATSGQNVFRYETFGNQGFWTDAMQLPQGIAAAKVTPLQALQLGLSVNIDAVNDATKQALAAALQQVAAGTDPNKTAFGDPNVTLSLINQNAVLGVVVFDPQGNRKALGNTGTLNIAGGDKIGLTCAVCHSITDNSVLPPTPAFKTTGSVGKELDGPTNHGIDVGTILATAQRTLAYYPMLQLQFKALKNATIGRGNFPGLLTTPTTLPTEAQADAYLTGTDANGQRYYPVGQFDAFPDGIGAPTHIQPFFRTDLSAPWGMDGGVNKLDDFNNTVYTVSLDPTAILTPGGRELLHVLAGPVGDEIANDYEQVLKGIGVIPAGKNTLDVVPYVQAQDYLPAVSAGSLVGRRVNNQELLDLNAYLNGLQPPPLGPFDATMAARGKTVFQTTRAAGGAACTQCHQLDPNKFVPPIIIPIASMYPGYNPTVVFNRAGGLSPIQKSFGGASPIYDNRLVVIDASPIGGPRGYALPLKLDLARRTSLLHDDEIVGTSFDDAADTMMNSAKRDAKAAHPFFVADPNDRKAVIEFMKSLTTSAPSFTAAGVANLASLMNGSVAPGELLAISGNALGIGMANASMQNTTVTFDGTAAPLFSVTTTQVTVIVPFSVSGQTTTQVQVTADGQKSAAVTLNVAAAAPGIFTLSGTGSGDAAVLNQDGSINSPGNPAAAGTAISFYATGAGQTSPAGVTGQIASPPLPRLTGNVSASIGGQTAQVLYAGNASGLLSSVVQVNAQVPTGAGTGDVSLSLNIGGTVSQPGVTVWVK
ncbi:MAG TPA: IPT/TIG domain-containing protein [Bryobacteraceae bacterium]|nr:IPT/TIG domain-containing protein [Bryobacteraceae bacterium]